MNFIGSEKTILYLYYILCIIYIHMCTWYSLIYLQNSFKLYGKDAENRQRAKLPLIWTADFRKSIYSDQDYTRKT